MALILLLWNPAFELQRSCLALQEGSDVFFFFLCRKALEPSDAGRTSVSDPSSEVAEEPARYADADPEIATALAINTGRTDSQSFVFCGSGSTHITSKLLLIRRSLRGEIRELSSKKTFCKRIIIYEQLLQPWAQMSESLVLRRETLEARESPLLAFFFAPLLAGTVARAFSSCSQSMMKMFTMNLRATK